MTNIPNINAADIQEFCHKTIADQMHLTAIDPEKRSSLIARDLALTSARQSLGRQN